MLCILGLVVLEEKTLQPFPLLLKKFFIGFFSRNRAAAFVRSGNLQVNTKESFFFFDSTHRYT